MGAGRRVRGLAVLLANEAALGSKVYLRIIYLPILFTNIILSNGIMIRKYHFIMNIFYLSKFRSDQNFSIFQIPRLIVTLK